MATSAIAAFGTFLKQGDGGTPEAFTTIAEVRDISGPELVSETVEVTNHDSVDGWKEYVATLLGGGAVTFGVNYIPTDATHDHTTGLLVDMTARTLRNWQLVFPDAGSTTWSFPAYVTGCVPAEPVAGELSMAVTLLISGKPTLA